MNTAANNNSALENLSFVAVVSCVLSAAYFLLTSVIA